MKSRAEDIMPKGKFFVIDGTDGSGKKTQTESGSPRKAFRSRKSLFPSTANRAPRRSKNT